MQDPRKIPSNLREKYNVLGPRYTSYPPATHFKPLDQDRLFARWDERKTLVADPGLSLYLHIPFCQARCLFCGCHTFIQPLPVIIEKYIESIIQEMEIASSRIGAHRTVIQVALGGGTPNYLSPSQLELLLGGLKQRWKFARDAELSVELDPRTVTTEKLDCFIKHGFNRFSLGVQDLEPSVLRLLRGNQNTAKIEQVINYIREHGNYSINFDLIYGLPGQTLETARRTARRVVDLSPSRIALYSYAHIPTIQAHQKTLEKQGLPDAELKLNLFLGMLECFQLAGYEFIGMDHFALPGDLLVKARKSGTLCRNFMGYTTARGADLVGLGASAISCVGSTYSQNEKDIHHYMDSISHSRPPVTRGFLLSQDDTVRRDLIMDLFCNFFVDWNILNDRWGIEHQTYFSREWQELESMISDGLLTMEPGLLRVTELGRFFIRNICMIFDRHLEPGMANAYSRTI